MSYQHERGHHDAPTVAIACVLPWGYGVQTDDLPALCEARQGILVPPETD